jgi:uncharacterized damage-inducible protein DinB
MPEAQSIPDPARQFLDQSREYLSAEYLPKIAACVARLSADDAWWRPDPASNSVGHLLLHLNGNLRQWIVRGLAGADADRDRAGEFAPAVRPAPGVLLDRLAATVEEADGVLSALDTAAGLQRRLTIQGREVTELQAVYHAVEHFAMHTGQIIYITKLRAGADLGFYRVDGGATRAAWKGRVRDL